MGNNFRLVPFLFTTQTKQSECSIAKYGVQSANENKAFFRV